MCGLAQALDVVGQRWTLLIVRELLIREACRYTDLRMGLPTIPTNLLADRLREMEAECIIEREEAPPPVSTTLYRLTERGRKLEAAILQLGVWGAARLPHAPRTDAFRPHWLVLPLRYHLVDRKPQDRDACIRVKADSEELFIAVSGGAVGVHLGTAPSAEATIEGPAQGVLAVLLGKIPLSRARAAGVKWSGPLSLLDRVAARVSSEAPVVLK
jgi:DNA-binding HxlR family transcriptional regulator